MYKILSILGCFLLVFALSAQTDSLSLPAATEDILEGYSQGQEEDAAFDYNDLFDRLGSFRRRPLDLNEASAADLSEFPFLTEIQCHSLPAYRKKYGQLVSIYELQSVPGFDLVTIRQLLPFVKVGQINEFSRRDATLDNRHQFILRWSRQLEDKAGYKVPKEDTAANRYLGSPDQLYLRYRLQRGNKLQLGFTAEKDAGEEFFQGSNRKGFDYYSAHLFLKNPTKHVRSLILGDFAVAMGQGLLVYQGFVSRKSALSTLVSRSPQMLRPFSSVSEFDFYRGAATILGLGKRLELMAFVSSRKRDANLDVQTDETGDDPDAFFATSLQTSGLHRTQSELDDRGAIRQSSAGTSLKYRYNRFVVGANALYEHLDKPLMRTSYLYNQFNFNGKQLFNLSLDYNWAVRNFYFFGESARSDNGAISTINGVLATLDRKLDLALVHRNFARDYQALNAKPFAETVGGFNEKGTYVGLQLQPTKRWRINTYYDQWRHDWLRFSVDAPSNGTEWLARLTFTQRRKWEVYAQLRNERKEENSSTDGIKVDRLIVRRNLQARLHFSLMIDQTLELRSRLDLGESNQGEATTKGMSIYQEVIYRPMGSRFSASTRYAIFSTGGYDVRFYSFERDVLNDFSIPAYYDRGSRFYLNLTYRLSKKLRLEARYATTYNPGLEQIGTGLERTDGNRRSEVKFQLRAEF